MRYSRIAADAPDDEEAPEHGLVGAQVHVPGGHEEELHERHDEQQHDDETVGNRALGVGHRDLERGDHDEDDGDDDVLHRRGVRPDLARQQAGRAT